MIFDIVTIFPQYFESPLSCGVLARAINKGLILVNPINLRDFTHDLHKTTDDRPFGGGEGMVMKVEPIWEAIESLKEHSLPGKVITFSPGGQVFDQQLATELVHEERLVFICGRYEGIDARVTEHIADIELSIGDYVMSGGEAAALVVIETISRLIPGVLGCSESAKRDSFSEDGLGGLLEAPQYTRPRQFNSWEVPEVLLSGNHSAISEWRRRESLRLTLERRPEILDKVSLNEQDIKWLRDLGWHKKNRSDNYDAKDKS